MAKSALHTITAKAKELKRKHPHRFDRLKKSERWSKGYIKQASAIYASSHKGKSPVGKKRRKAGKIIIKREPGGKTSYTLDKPITRLKWKKRVGAKKKAAKKRPASKKSTAGRKLVKYVEKTSTERVMAGKKRKRRSHTVYRAGHRRKVGKSDGGGTKMLIGLAIGAGLIYMLTKKPTTPTTYQLPPVRQTTNYTRNTQSQDLVNYAIAAGLAITAITGLIEKLNNSTDQQVNDIYDHVNTTGDVGAWV